MAYVLTRVPDDYCDSCPFKRPGEVVCQRFGEFLESDENCQHYRRCKRCTDESLLEIGQEAYAVLNTLLLDNQIHEATVRGYAYIIEEPDGQVTFQHISRLFRTEQEAKEAIEAAERTHRDE